MHADVLAHLQDLLAQTTPVLEARYDKIRALYTYLEDLKPTHGRRPPFAAPDSSFTLDETAKDGPRITVAGIVFIDLDTIPPWLRGNGGGNGKKNFWDTFDEADMLDRVKDALTAGDLRSAIPIENP